MTDPPCGCTNAPDPTTGVLRSVSKCPGHAAMRRDPATLGREYYEELGLLDEDAPRRYVAELEEALGSLTVAEVGGVALEIGCGASPYVGAIRAAGYAYAAIEPSVWAARWMQDQHRAGVFEASLEDVPQALIKTRYGLILAAHVFEHLEDAPAGIGRCAEWLAPDGELWVVVPDDSDPFNPDHIYFFTTDTLRRCLESAGLVVERMAVRRHVPHENFVYARARKP